MSCRRLGVLDALDHAGDAVFAVACVDLPMDEPLHHVDQFSADALGAAEAS